MSQATLSFPAFEAANVAPGVALLAGTASPTSMPGPADPTDRVAFDIGWDHAQHGLVPPVDLMHADSPTAQGWLAGKAVFGKRTSTTSRSTRQWLALRLSAWQQGLDFDTAALTPRVLAQLAVDRCPVTRASLGGAPGSADAPQMDRLHPQLPFVAGNVAVLSRLACQSWQGLDVASAVRRARALESLSGTGADDAGRMGAAAWWRLAALRSFVVPMPFADATRLPLAVLPPRQVRPVNTVQALQWLVTSLFLAPGWSLRCREVAAWLPAHTLRQDFHLFVGALAPRVLEAGTEAKALRQALEDAWLQERVQRRWQHFVLSLGEASTASLLERLLASGLVRSQLLQMAAVEVQPGRTQTPDETRAVQADRSALRRVQRKGQPKVQPTVLAQARRFQQPCLGG